MIIGVDFGGPQRAREQRKKIIAIGAQAIGHRRYRIVPDGINARLLTHEPPGWSAQELLAELLARPARVVGFDFPFGIPEALLSDRRFAMDAGYPDGTFPDWRAFSSFVAAHLPLADPLDFSPFAAWRTPAERPRLWARRATDLAARAQPPLKNIVQNVFQMTLLGVAMLSKLWESGAYRVRPFPGGRGDGEVIEVYPGATLRQLGLASYKSKPAEAIRLCMAACTASGIELDVDDGVRARCIDYNSCPKQKPENESEQKHDHDAADAFVALCTAILYAEGECREVILDDAPEGLKEREGAIWVPRSDRPSR